jgi:hypothetical protein
MDTMEEYLAATKDAKKSQDDKEFEFTYEQMLDHIGDESNKISQKTFNKCIRNKVHTCPLGCCASQKFSKTELVEHLENDCQLIKVKCETCKEEFLRKEVKVMKHDAGLCTKNLQEKYKSNQE